MTHLTTLLFSLLILLVLSVSWCISLWDRWFGFKLDFPHTLEALRKQQTWCLSQLRLSEAIPNDATVTSYEVTPFRADEIFRSDMGQVSITYKHNQRVQTFRCLAKVAPTAGTLWSRAVYMMQGNHNKEIGFYKDLAKLTPNLVPTVYAAHASAGTGHFCLLMKQELDKVEYSEAEGCPPKKVPDCLAMMAAFHAKHWNTTTTRHDWLDKVAASGIEFFVALAWKPKERALRRYARKAWHHSNQPQTVLHGDARIGNMMFVGQEQRPLWLDWQATRLGRAAFDVAYFLVLSTPPSARLTHEEKWLRSYLAQLKQANPNITLTWTELLDDYKHACLLLTALLVLPMLSGETSSDPSKKSHLLSGALAWWHRILTMPRHFDEEWLLQHYGMSLGEWTQEVKRSLTAPPALNGSVWMLAHWIKEHGGMDTLLTQEGLDSLLQEANTKE